MIVVVMGVAGAGKSTIGAALARELGWRFIDADDYHPAANIAKMATGEPLDDDDRWPWLDSLNALLSKHSDAVIACSALKESYRSRLTAGLPAVRLVHLHGTPELIGMRLAARRHRYMPASLLASQFAALEPPQGAISVDVAHSPDQCVRSIVASLRIA